MSQAEHLAEAFGGGSFRVTLGDEALRAGFVPVEADQTIHESANMVNRAEVLRRLIAEDNAEIDEEYANALRELERARSEASAIGAHYEQRTEEFSRDSTTYMIQKTEHDARVEGFTARQNAIMQEITYEQSVLDQALLDKQEQESKKVRSQSQASEDEITLALLNEEARRLEEDFLKKAETDEDQESIDAYSNYGGQSTFHHGLHNLTPEKQAAYKATVERRDTSLNDYIAANDEITQLIRLEATTEVKIQDLTDRLHGMNDEAEALLAEGQRLENVFKRLIAQEELIRKQFSARFEPQEDEASVRPTESQAPNPARHDEDYRVSVEDETPAPEMAEATSGGWKPKGAPRTSARATGEVHPRAQQGSGKQGWLSRKRNR